MGTKNKERGIVITIPKAIRWEDYEKELNAVSDWSQVMNFKASVFPKELNLGDRVYVCHNGFIMGWQTFVGFYNGDFVCSTTGKDWKGGFIQRSGPFHYLEKPIPCNGFRGFRYINYTTDEKHSEKKLLEESRSVNDMVQEETSRIVDAISKRMTGERKQEMEFKVKVFGNLITVKSAVYNAKNANDYASLSNDPKFENSFTPQTKTLRLFLFFKEGRLTDYGYDNIAHELSHIYQFMLTPAKITDINALLHKYVGSRDRFEQHLVYLLYFSDQNEQDAIIQGLEASLKPYPVMLNVSERYASSYAKETLDLFGQLLDEFSKMGNGFEDAIKPYRAYGLDYGRILRRAKNAYKRFKLKIAHVLSTHENESMGRPDLERLKKDLYNNKEFKK